MASDQVRKKWNTIFMGEREATVQEFDAMQEPVRRERLRQQQQEDYLARVRVKAEERAREILGAAYAERQRVLDEARVEAQTLNRQLTRDAQELKAQSLAALTQVETERASVAALKEEAAKIRDAAHNEGFQAGVEQAGDELKEFRAEMGQTLSGLLCALKAQRSALAAFWREELADLTRAAVEAGTGWLLEAEHTRILHALVLQSLKLLEDRAVISLRVHPDDEASVGDLFQAARERVPELGQWIVKGDASIERGGFVAESASGSVDSRREHYRELVDNILTYLTLPPEEADQQNTEDSATADHEAGGAKPPVRADVQTPPPAPLPEEDGESPARVQAPALEAEESESEGQPLPAPEDNAAMPQTKTMPPNDSPAPPRAEGLPAEDTASVVAALKENPSLAELEEELLPVPVDDHAGMLEIPSVDIFSQGGFLPGGSPEKTP